MGQAAGQLNKRLTLQRQPPKGDRGRSVGDWVDVATVWAKIETLGGSGMMDASQAYPSAQVRVTVRRGLAVKQGMRFRYGAKNEFFYVGFAEEPDRANETIACLCSLTPDSSSPAEG